MLWLFLPCWPVCNLLVHPVLGVQSEHGAHAGNHGWGGVAGTAGGLHFVGSSSRQEGEQSSKQRLLVIQILSLCAGHSGWQLLVVHHHHQLVEAQLEGDEGLWLASYMMQTVVGLMAPAVLVHLPTEGGRQCGQDDISPRHGPVLCTLPQLPLCIAVNRLLQLILDLVDMLHLLFPVPMQLGS
jgi:hypothetical protein